MSGFHCCWSKPDCFLLWVLAGLSNNDVLRQACSSSFLHPVKNFLCDCQRTGKKRKKMWKNYLRISLCIPAEFRGQDRTLNHQDYILTVCLGNSWRSLKCEDNAVLLVVDRLGAQKLSSLLKLSSTPRYPSQQEEQHFCSGIQASAVGELRRHAKPYLSGLGPFRDP